MHRFDKQHTICARHNNNTSQYMQPRCRDDRLVELDDDVCGELCSVTQEWTWHFLSTVNTGTNSMGKFGKSECECSPLGGSVRCVCSWLLGGSSVVGVLTECSSLARVSPPFTDV